jgi:serine/threonine protein kinase
MKIPPREDITELIVVENWFEVLKQKGPPGKARQRELHAMIGTPISHYRITDKLGEGGMGEVYLAEDTRLWRKVALKVLPEEVAQDEARLARFEREAKLLASLNHTNIATLHGLEEHEGQRFLVMDLAEGETLAGRIKGGPVPVDEALNIARQLAERPIFHHLEHRVETHIFLCLLAFHLLVTIDKTLLDNTVHTSWATVRETLSSHETCTVVMQTSDKGILRIRDDGTPEPEHKQLCKLLAIPSDIMKPKRTWTPRSKQEK